MSIALKRCQWPISTGKRRSCEVAQADIILVLQINDQTELLKNSWVLIHLIDITFAVARNELPMCIKLANGNE